MAMATDLEFWNNLLDKKNPQTHIHKNVNWFQIIIMIIEMGELGATRWPYPDDVIRQWREHSPGVHKAVDDGVVERVWHGQPEDEKVNLLGVRLMAYRLVHLHCDEEAVVWQPTEAENHHHCHHHFHHLGKQKRMKPLKFTNSRESSVTQKNHTHKQTNTQKSLVKRYQNT